MADYSMMAGGPIGLLPAEEEPQGLLGRLGRVLNDPAKVRGLTQMGLSLMDAAGPRPLAQRMNSGQILARGIAGFNQGADQFRQQELEQQLAVMNAMEKAAKAGQPQDNYTDFKIDDLGRAWGRNKVTGVFEKIPMQSDDFAKYKTSTYVDPANGGITSVLLNPRDIVAGQADPQADAPQGARPGVIEIGGQRTTQANEQAMSFYNRMRNASSELDTLAQQGFFNPGVWDKFADAAPGSVQAFIQSDDYRRYKAAASDWIKATLRKESGAAIPDNEMDSYFEQYFPQPGESQAVVEQKKRARAIQEKNMMQEAGPALQRRGVNEAPAQPVGVRTPEQAKAAGWKLMTDAKGNRAYVGPDNQIVEVK